MAWSPGWTEGWKAKLTGGPGKTSVRAGFGLFYNPIEQLVLEQFSAEPPFGGSSIPFEHATSIYRSNFNLAEMRQIHLDLSSIKPLRRRVPSIPARRT